MALSQGHNEPQAARRSISAATSPRVKLRRRQYYFWAAWQSPPVSARASFFSVITGHSAARSAFS